ncbi:T9SS type A sorting domain-containing protein [bacterium]|nr:T9SS type A sorting domain-containing protein [bacterium]
MADQVALRDDVTCTGGLTVTGTLTSWAFAAVDVTVEGLLRNEGTITDGAHPVRLAALDDIDNQGVVSCAAVVIAGTEDQRVGIGAGLDVGTFEILSHLGGDTFQWYRDGEPLAGATGPVLVLDGVDLADLGTYQCVSDGLWSRSVEISESLATTAAPAVSPLTLAPSHPNPFNPATTLRFSLPRATEVRLAVYDVAGREVARLVDGLRPAGEHTVLWQPRGLASGTYLYRLRAGDSVLTGRATLLK